MRLLFALAALLLCSCWEGERFYTHDEARAVIAPGTYRLLRPDGSTMGEYRVSRRADGMTVIPDFSVAGFVPLDRENHFYLTWFETISGYSPAPGDTVYGLLERQGSDYRLLVPTCEDTRAIATAFGATVQEMRLPMPCKFPDRTSLEAGIRGLIPRINESYRLVPVRGVRPGQD